MEFEKVYTFHRGRYVAEVAYRVQNQTAAAWKGRMYGQLQQAEWVDPESSYFIHTFTGAALHTDQERYRKIAFQEIAHQPLALTSPGGWAAMLQHYFVAAWVPPADGVNHFYTRMLEGPRYVIGAMGPELEVPPGASAELPMRLYVGPKIQERLSEVAPGLELTLDYGIFWFLSQPLFWALDKIHDVVGNWGWAIIALTIGIKLTFYHLSATSYRSMARMRKLQPRLMELKERFGDDRQRMSQAMMELYRKEKVNPLGGCLPIVIQIPVFIALYWVLVESVELRQAPFVLWLNDLSDPDPYYVLPLLMGATMLVQQWLNPAPMDPLQQKVMMTLPIVFTVFFAFFPAGLVLYWTTNNALSIAQQWFITRRIERGIH
jgi:YidC/Oxa1 family membrane protein insertase